MRVRAAWLLLACLLVAACSGDLAPTSSPAPSATPRPQTPTPFVQPTADNGASLSITAGGSCNGINYALCYSALLLEPGEARGLFDWVPGKSDMRFADSATYPVNTIIGPPVNAPLHLAQGRWAAGVGVAQGSDVVGQPTVGAPWCVTEFIVGPETQRVEIAISNDPTCQLDVAVLPSPTTAPARTISIPDWSPPPGGIMDDCHYGTMLLRFDGNGRPWYQDVDTNEHIDIAPEWLQGNSVRIGSPTVLIDSAGNEHPDLSIEERHCVQYAGGQAWMGGPYLAWEPWDRHLGDVGYLAHEILHAVRGHEGGAPPAAISLEPPDLPEPSKDTLSQLDAEIESTGPDHWSSAFPAFYLGGSGTYEPADDEGGVFGYNGENWITYPGQGGFGSGDIDGSRARRFVDFVTPAGNDVAAFGESMTLWDNCSKVDVPEFFAGPYEPGYESDIDSDGGLVTIYVYHSDHETLTRLIVDDRDPACLAHPILGPIIDQLLTPD